jgi:hypothetical protein
MDKVQLDCNISKLYSRVRRSGQYFHSLSDAQLHKGTEILILLRETNSYISRAGSHWDILVEETVLSAKIQSVFDEVSRCFQAG